MVCEDGPRKEARPYRQEAYVPVLFLRLFRIASIFIGLMNGFMGGILVEWDIGLGMWKFHYPILCGVTRKRRKTTRQMEMDR